MRSRLKLVYPAFLASSRSSSSFLIQREIVVLVTLLSAIACQNAMLRQFGCNYWLQYSQGLRVSGLVSDWPAMWSFLRMKIRMSTKSWRFNLTHWLFVGKGFGELMLSSQLPRLLLVWSSRELLNYIMCKGINPAHLVVADIMSWKSRGKYGCASINFHEESTSRSKLFFNYTIQEHHLMLDSRAGRQHLCRPKHPQKLIFRFYDAFIFWRPTYQVDTIWTPKLQSA